MTDPRFAYQETFACVQCGYCLPACPTYQSMGKETHSPRGRINLVKMAAEGKLSLSELAEPIDLCLGCRACETACPTNVQYGKILDSAKTALTEERKSSTSWLKKKGQQLAFEKVLPNPQLLQTLGTGLYLYQQSGAAKLSKKTKLTDSLLPEALASFEAVTPAAVSPWQRKQRPHHLQAKGEPRYRVGYFTGCLMDTLFATINDQAIQLLQLAGCEVTVIEEQTCCGALQHHSGERELAKNLAKANIAAFEQHSFDWVVNSIGGCGAMLIEYGELLHEEEEWRERAERFAAKNVDISVILAKVLLPFTTEINKVATYQPSCHMTHVQKRTTEPLQLLQLIPGITYVPLNQKEMCCGSAGIYNLVHYGEAMEILDHKMKEVHRVKPEMIVTTNPGCHLQMKMGVKREGLEEQIEVVHLVELLAEACGL
ncbi:(Fe-S)-binding protein [Desmospora activa]|uniref:Glycolate oxidase iron-sulfur subunit n=1 Tax=Desmospora activa DSM 45169 TaxID=1121389 RepID=A0A2T4Z6P6_9BACL|nr:(Fe-S)-binding protein [Desmospora activa]PTM57562.1 glycolate oxidase iron-sulfur subunit [Desmospora activa DSM 45169]